MTISREDFRKLAAGHCALTNGIQKEHLSAFVEGSVFAFDYLTKTKKPNGNGAEYLAPISEEEKQKELEK